MREASGLIFAELLAFGSIATTSVVDVDAVALEVDVKFLLFVAAVETTLLTVGFGGAVLATKMVLTGLGAEPSASGGFASCVVSPTFGATFVVAFVIVTGLGATFGIASAVATGFTVSAGAAEPEFEGNVGATASATGFFTTVGFTFVLTSAPEVGGVDGAICPGIFPRNEFENLS